MTQGLIGNIFVWLVSIIINFIALLLTPIDNLILAFLPDLSNAFTSIGMLFNVISQGIAWDISLTGLSSTCISLIVIYYTFKLTAPIAFYLIKLAISWYNKLKV